MLTAFTIALLGFSAPPLGRAHVARAGVAPPRLVAMSHAAPAPAPKLAVLEKPSRVPLRPLVRAALTTAAALPLLAATMPAWAAAAASASAPAKLHIGQKLSLWLQSFGLPNELILVLISTLPVIELRGAVPVGAWMGVSPLRTFVVCVLGNTAAVALLLAALRLPLVEKLLKPVLDKARSKMKGIDEGSIGLGLALFVGIPLPGTGGWTGAMIAHILGIPFSLAIGSIGLGVALAGGIMTALTLAGWYGAAVAIAAMVLFCVGALLERSAK